MAQHAGASFNPSSFFQFLGNHLADASQANFPLGLFIQQYQFVRQTGPFRYHYQDFPLPGSLARLDAFHHVFKGKRNFRQKNNISTPGSADVILLPEIPFSLENVVECIKARKAAGQREILVVVSEGARLADELVLLDEKTQGEVRLGGIGKVIAKKLEEATGIETRSCVLGHIQRGGSPCSYDRILGTRFGSYAVELVEKRQFSCMVALRGTQMTAVPIEEAVKTLKLVDPDCQLVRTARDLGVCFGD